MNLRDKWVLGHMEWPVPTAVLRMFIRSFRAVDGALCLWEVAPQPLHPVNHRRQHIISPSPAAVHGNPYRRETVLTRRAAEKFAVLWEDGVTPGPEGEVGFAHVVPTPILRGPLVLVAGLRQTAAVSGWRVVIFGPAGITRSYLPYFERRDGGLVSELILAEALARGYERNTETRPGY